MLLKAAVAKYIWIRWTRFYTSHVLKASMVQCWSGPLVDTFDHPNPQMIPSIIETLSWYLWSTINRVSIQMLIKCWLRYVHRVLIKGQLRVSIDTWTQYTWSDFTNFRSSSNIFQLIYYFALVCAFFTWSSHSLTYLDILHINRY